MIIHLHRTFSELTNSATDSDEEDWGQFLGERRGEIIWADLHQKPLVVVLGEAGIGKTVEFKNEVERLQTAGEFAFFVPLNQLSDINSWQLALTGCNSEFEAWLASEELGYFFLDAVDEARLKSHADFEKALTVVQRALGSIFSRARLAISSRVTDWSSSAVRSVVDTRLAKPIQRAFTSRLSISPPCISPDASNDVAPTSHEAQPVTTFVVGLDPLMKSEALRCASAFGLQEELPFWEAVAEGDYDFMATRPLDLRWMVVLWNKSRSLGTYRELIEENISNRLLDSNESYEAAGEVLSLDRLYAGAIELAAAAEFGGYAFFMLNLDETSDGNEEAPHIVLTDWHPTAIRRLLATSLFDEASFGRIKFHHRSVREYLAAQWVDKQLSLGVPLQRLKALFARSPFGKLVLIPSRRPVLSWLATINVVAREWVVREFPEIFLHEGDPQSWDRISADNAFTNFIEASKYGLQVSWFNSSSELRRVGHVLSAGKIATTLADVGVSPQVRSICFQLARHAKLTDCASISFAIYRNTLASAWERLLALDVLEHVGSVEHRQEILADLKGALLGTNELIARALTVTDWKHLNESELSAIFYSTRGEAEYGSGPVTRVFKDELLPQSDLETAVLLLGAVLTSLPQIAHGRRFALFPESERPERAWLIDVLPACFERVLILLPHGLDSYPVLFMEAAERIEAQRDSGFADRDDLSRLHSVIARHTNLRWSVALAIAQSDDIKASLNRLTWGANCLVSFGAEDLQELTRRANDLTLPKEEREIWFYIGVTVTFVTKRRFERSRALATFGLGPSGSERSLLVKGEYEKQRNAARHAREYKISERDRKERQTQSFEDYKSRLLADLLRIRDGTSIGALQSLLQHSYVRLGQKTYSEVNFDAISQDLGVEIANALREGLETYWQVATPPDPSAYSNGNVPWSALIALAGLGSSMKDATVVAALSAMNVAKAAQFAVWELNGPPPWLETLARVHTSIVAAALSPWILAQAQISTPRGGMRDTLGMAISCAPEIRRQLLSPVLPLITSGRIREFDTLKALISALAEDQLLSPSEVGALCLGRLTSSTGSNGRISEIALLQIWMDIDAPAAWSWFAEHVNRMSGGDEAEVHSFTELAGGFKWLALPLSDDSADMLLNIHSLLSKYLPSTPIADEAHEKQLTSLPIYRMREAIPNVFLRSRGKIGHESLVALLSTLSDPDEQNWMRAKIAEHSALDATQNANYRFSELKAIASPFLFAPQTEAQLYEQVIARLEEIRINLEEGPFSERDLFSRGIPEKFLQRWLAAKFRETQNRRFSVHREEEVDDDNMTDIQLSCPSGNVCIEIKPVDADRSYSANSLTDTLRTQIVGQYLQGTNSSRGILVLMQLDNKTWSIPGGSTGQSFDSLVSYLDSQAKAIKYEFAGVNELTVFGIRCVV